MPEVRPEPALHRRLPGFELACALAATVAVLAVGVGARSDPATRTEPEPEVVNSPWADVLLTGAPHVRQKPDYCGEACAEMALRRLGVDIDQDGVFALTGVDPALDRGAWTRELKVGLEAVGFRVGQVWREVEVADLDRQMEAQWAELHADLLRGVPSIICTRYSDAPKTTEHFRLILGYDASTDEVIYHEPAEDEGAGQRMDRDLFLSIWPLKYDAERWSVIRFALEPGPKLLPADPVAARAQELRGTLPTSFTVVEQAPFVVAGDEDPATVRRRARSTVRWARDLLREQYFPADLPEVWTVWLFKDDDSYRQHAREFWNEEPDTPYGYASSTHRALVMNIGTGGGTLVHEMVHPYVAANIPDCPPWFNEGLASLYEACSERDGRIVGLLNWRLSGLQAAIEAGTVPTFAELTAMDEHAFYELDSGSNYGQSRYLLYYLQDKGLLDDFYDRFVAGQEQDPGGFAALKATLGEQDMAAFQRRWQRWVLALEPR
jgi:hypothetical protein